MNAPQPSSQGRDLPLIIRESVNRWRRQSATLQYAYIFLGIVAILVLLSVATFTDLLVAGWTRVLSFIGVGAAALTTGFRLQQKGNEMRKAYFELVALSMVYKSDNTMSDQQLIEQFRRLALSVASLAGPDSKFTRQSSTQHDA